MTVVRIHHRTAYRYRQQVGLGPHRLMVRPREQRDVRIQSAALTISPEATVTWATDVYGNAVAVAEFEAPAELLLIDSSTDVALTAPHYPVFAIDPSAHHFPFRYSDDLWADLGSLTTNQYPDAASDLRSWAQAFVAGPQTDTLSLLKDLNAGAGSISYRVREDEGTQPPRETLSIGSGSCRDLATLFIEAVRSLGFGARAVSGYLHDATRSLRGSDGGGSTHAWAEVFLPGAGWVSFDPTNGSVGAANLVPVAVARDIRQVVPVIGSFVGSADALQEMTVEVCVTSIG